MIQIHARMAEFVLYSNTRRLAPFPDVTVQTDGMETFAQKVYEMNVRLADPDE